MKKIIIANWKMNPHSPEAAARLARDIDKAVPRRGATVVIAPPFPYLAVLGRVLKRARLGAQDVFWEAKGARTGEISGHQLKHFKVGYVIIGHSERRALGETDAVVNRKVRASLGEKLNAVLCVGEPWRVRRKGLAAAKNFIKSQLVNDLANTKSYKLKAESLIIAYEPVWAIGTGKNDNPRDAAEMAKFIKSFLNSKFKIRDSRVLYGGSVNSRDAADFAGEEIIDGFLVGGASLSPAEFGKIIRVIANNAKSNRE